MADRDPRDYLDGNDPAYGEYLKELGQQGIDNAAAKQAAERRHAAGIYDPEPKTGKAGSGEMTRNQLADKERMEDSAMRGYGQDINKSEKDAVGKFGAGAAAAGAASGWKPSDGSDTVGKGFVKGGGGQLKSKKGGWTQRRKKAVAGWLAAAVLGLGAGAGIGGTLAAPAQFIQAANQLGDFHMADPEDTADNRLFLLARYIREPNKPQNLRMGILANKYADKVETRLNRAGVVSAYTPKFGYLNGYYIDKPNLRADSIMSGIKEKPIAEFTEHIKKTYGIELHAISLTDGLFYIEGSKLSFKQQRMFVSDMLRASGSGRVSGAVQARVMGARAGIDWHPMKGNNRYGRAAENKLISLEERYKKWREERKLKISQGAEAIRPTVDKKPDPQGGEGAKQGADDVASNIDETQSQADQGRTTGDMSELNSKMTGIKNGSITGISAVAVVCLLHGIAVNVDNIEQAQVLKPLIRIYGDLLAMGNQIMFGDGDVDVEQMGFLQKQMYDPKTKTSWDQAASIQAQNGQNQSGPDLNNALKPGGENGVVKFFGSIPGLEATCEAASTTTGQVVMTLAGGLTVANAVITGAFLAFGDEAIDTLSHWIAGDPVNPFIAGAQYGGAADYGGLYAGRDMGTSMGGRELNGTETIEIEATRKRSEEHDFRQKSLAYRLFDTTDNRTLLGSIISKQRPDAKANIAALTHNMLNFGNTIASMPQNLFAEKAGAVRPYTYPDKKIGFSVDELDSPLARENPYPAACKVIGCPQSNIKGILEDGDKGDAYFERAKACFGMEINRADGGVTSTGKMPTKKDQRDNNCNEKFDTKSKCEERSPSCDWARIRFHILTQKTQDGYFCYLGDAESCQSSNFDSSNETTYIPNEHLELLAADYRLTPAYGARS